LGFNYLQSFIYYLTPLGLPSSLEEEENEGDVFDIPESFGTQEKTDESKPIIRKLSEFHLW
jgi:hypothetical protein